MAKVTDAERLEATWESLKAIRDRLEDGHPEVAELVTKAMRLLDDASERLADEPW